ncbi:unnamed protein product [Echinostoma caproni]|uniref:DUF1992 domain-containing protein n=1 Tax=Echinostoma caproni TaxID=27848 RepID=A0A183AQV6_9TREM|nr:unnamed protein product [Echinostoma caproni]
MFRYWVHCGRLVLLNARGSYCGQVQIGRMCSSSIGTVPSNKLAPDDGSDWPRLIRDIAPAGSALFRENDNFSPVVFPDPLFEWDRVQQSLVARKRVSGIPVKDLEQMGQEISSILRQLDSLEESRSYIKAQFNSDQSINIMPVCGPDSTEWLREVGPPPKKEKGAGGGNDENLRNQARLLRIKRKDLKAALHELTLRFQKEALGLPNYIHEDYIPGSQSSVVKTLDRGSSKKLIRWPTVADDQHVT